MKDCARIVDNLVDTSCEYSFDKMLIPNDIFRYLDKLRLSDSDSLLSVSFDKCLYVVSTLYRRYQIAFNIAKKCHWLIDLTKWAVPIYSKVFNSVLGTGYRKYVNYLVSLGILNHDSSYMKGGNGVKGRCKHYWFTPSFLSYTYRYLDSKYKQECGDIQKRVGGVRIVHVKDKFLFKHLAKHAEEVRQEQLSIPLIHDLYDDLKHFKFDVEHSVEVLDDLVNTGKIPVERKEEELHKVLNFNSFETNPYALYCKRDEYGRVHTNVTQLKKEVRKNCLYCDGKPTVGIDIKSSQGAFLYTVLHSCIDYILYSNNGNLVNFYSMDTRKFDRVNFDHDRLIAEDNDFRRLLDNGSLYEFFLNHLISDYGYTNIDRAIVKKEFLTCLFCGWYYSVKKHKLVKAIREIWNKYFPNLFRIICIIKSGNFAALAHDLQRTESHLVFDVVYNRVKKEIGCPLCTVHDSIIVDAQYGEQVKKIFDNALVEFHVPTFTEMEVMELVSEDAFQHE